MYNRNSGNNAAIWLVTLALWMVGCDPMWKVEVQARLNNRVPDTSLRDVIESAPGVQLNEVHTFEARHVLDLYEGREYSPKQTHFEVVSNAASGVVTQRFQRDGTSDLYAYRVWMGNRPTKDEMNRTKKFLREMLIYIRKELERSPEGEEKGSGENAMNLSRKSAPRRGLRRLAR